MKKVVTLLIVFNSINSFADCSALYQKRIADLQGRTNPARTTVITNVAAEGIAIGTLVAIGSFTPAAAVTLPAVAIAAGGYLLELELEKISMRKVSQLIRDSHEGKGYRLTKATARINRFLKNDVDEEEVAELVKRLDTENAFCELNPSNDKPKLWGMPKVIRNLRKMMANR